MRRIFTKVVEQKEKQDLIEELSELVKALMSKIFTVRDFFNQETMGTIKEQTEVTTVQLYRPKLERQQASVVLHTDASIKLRENLGGSGLILLDKYGVPLALEMSSLRTTPNNSFKMEAWAMMRGLNFCVNEALENVVIRMDAKYVLELILNEESFKKKRSNIVLDSETMDFVHISREILEQQNWNVEHICRQLNMAADFTARQARIMEEKSMLDINTHTLYMKDDIPLGLKNILANDMGLSHIIARRVYGHYQTREVQVPIVPEYDVNNHLETLGNWIKVVSKNMANRTLKCVFVEFWNEDKSLVEEVEVTVRYMESSNPFSNKWLMELLYSFDVTRSSIQSLANKELKARLVLGFWDNKKKNHLQPKVRIEHPTTRVDLGEVNFGCLSLHPKITTRYAHIRKYEECDMAKYKEGLEELNKIPERDFDLYDDRVVLVSGELSSDIFKFVARVWRMAGGAKN